MTSKKLKKYIYFAFFSAIMIVLMLTPLGFIPIGPIRATTLHIPVILAGVLFGPAFGAGIGFVFGLLSLLINTYSPTITSFVFSPFITIGGTSGNFASLIIVFGPRIFLGFFSGWLHQFLFRLKWKNITMTMVVSGINSFIHSVLVLSLIALFFGSPYSSAKGMDISELFPFISTILATNGIAEMTVAAILVPFIYKALKPLTERK